MRIVFDKKNDIAYFHLINDSISAEAARTHACDPIGVNGEINLDFNEAGQLVGIEVLEARRLLPSELLAQAEKRIITAKVEPPRTD